MSPHTRFVPLVVGAALLTAACGSPAGSEPAGTPSYTIGPQPSGAGPLPGASVPVPGYTMPNPGYTMPNPGYTMPNPGYPNPGYNPGYHPGYTLPTTTPAEGPLTKSPTPTPAHAAKCGGQPSPADILALIKGKPGIPSKTLQVQDGPFCSGTWSFTTVKLAGSGTDQMEPLMVVATGKAATLALVAAGSDVCNAQVQAAPAGIRVMACGF
ncbi:putative global transcription activator SNF2L2 [Actinoplanes sp. SE50]|uniref:hypothetical protein n=1 Tax=unclassified Actinoplanes TaxID=2626549 RepID=UPI00023EDD90|nr:MULTISPECIES: hypothetical protein [unclassified Actinoplanes]AEV89179.1 putative global transcription activator SNF2L2 [Actinoplanes sp. SE50/110]ATO87587.1 putative global transcription activator SNF2L2 [Actinoplanes sp. SE50]SLM05005.1 putative global transcription activator SNF2L2 [Actinoplanes sp. SE50/110]